MLNAVLLNDTSASAHHGSRLVVATIRGELRKRGIDITATAASGTRWADDRGFLEQMAGAAVVVINGEGTLHHGARAGERLLHVVDHPARADRPVALINTLWQDNPSGWSEPLRRMSLVSVRDGRSQRALASDGVKADLCPDLSFLHQAPQVTRDPDRIAFGDSVRHGAAAALLTAYRTRKGPKLYLPIRSLQRHLPGNLSVGQHAANLRHRLRGVVQTLLDRNRIMARDAEEYVSHIARCGFHVTGRYHAACLSVVTSTPFAAIASNSHKIEALIEDIGLDRRVVSDVRDATDRAPFSADEAARIEAWLALAKHRAAEMFDRIADVAQRPAAAASAV